jgi:exodeoxyribonuclease V alpha subunit
MAIQELRAFRGEVSDVKHYAPDTGFLVFRLRLMQAGKFVGQSLSCAGVSETPIEVGSLVEVYGFQEMSKWGPQIKFSAYHVLSGNSVVALAAYLKSIAKFLGPKKSHDLAAHFGTELEHVIEHEPSRLTEVDGIGESIKESIVDGWVRDKSVRSVKVFLCSLGLSDSKIRQIVAHHGPGYDDVIKENPYILVHEGIGFSVCETIAERLNLDPKAPCRIQAICLEAIYKLTVAGEGNLYVNKEQILRFANDLNARFSPERKLGDLSVTWEDLAGALAELKDNGYVVEDKDRIYPLALFFYEARSAEVMTHLLRGEANRAFQDMDPEQLVDRYEAHERIAIPDFKFSEKQKDAIQSFVKQKVMVVTGPPGTGKTTIVKTFVRILEEKKLSFCLLAPTGAASKRLANTSGREAHTIHRFLGYNGSAWGFHSENKITESVVIIDECSMVDMELFYRILSSVPEYAHVVLVGDVDQLPSVGPGNVLKDIIASGVKTIMLDQVHRQAALSDIVVEANKIKDGDSDLSLFRADINADICFVQTATDYVKAEQSIVQVCKALSNSPHLTYQVLTPRNEGELSVSSLNKLLQESLNPGEPSAPGFSSGPRFIRLDKDSIIKIKDKVLIIKNNYNLRVFNGDIGVVEKFSSENVYIKLITGENAVIPINSAREMLRLAYATTVHKSQGSEYSVVILPLIKAHGAKLLQRNLLYTALTRARKKVVVVGQGSAIEAAIDNAAIKLRSTSLASRVKECLGQEAEGDKVVFPYTSFLYSFSQDAQNFRAIEKLLYPGAGGKTGAASSEGDSVT